MYLSIIIPAYNEEKRIGRTLETVESFLALSPYEAEIIVANDGSKDATADVVRRVSPRARIVGGEKNEGKGFAVRRGMLAAKGDWRLFMDADGSTSITELPALLLLAEKGNDVVIGSRRSAGAKISVRQDFFRSAGGFLFRFFAQLLVPLPVRDSQNGFKLFSAKAAEAIFPQQSIAGWVFDIEVLALARKLSFSIAEAPIEWRNDAESRLGLRGMITSLRDLFRIRRTLKKIHIQLA